MITDAAYFIDLHLVVWDGGCTLPSLAVDCNCFFQINTEFMMPGYSEIDKCLEAAMVELTKIHPEIKITKEATVGFLIAKLLKNMNEASVSGTLCSSLACLDMDHEKIATRLLHFYLWRKNPGRAEIVVKDILFSLFKYNCVSSVELNKAIYSIVMDDIKSLSEKEESNEYYEIMKNKLRKIKFQINTELEKIDAMTEMPKNVH